MRRWWWLVGCLGLGALLAIWQLPGTLDRARPSGFVRRHQQRTSGALGSLDRRVRRMAEHMYDDLADGQQQASARFAANTRRAAEQFLKDLIGQAEQLPAGGRPNPGRRVHASMLCMMLEKLPTAGLTTRPGERTVLVSWYNGKLYDPLLPELRRNRLDYCAVHGYSCALPGNLSACGVSEEFTAELGLVKPGAWAKLPLLLRCMQTGQFGRLVWLDMDIVIARPELSIDTLLAASGPTADLTLTEDCNCRPDVPHSPFNTGIMVVQQTAAAFELLAAALEMGCELEQVRDHPWWDQYALHRLYSSRKAAGFRIVPQSAQWQSYDGFADPDTDPAPFAVHVAGRGELKLPSLISIFKRLKIDHDNGG